MNIRVATLFVLLCASGATAQNAAAPKPPAKAPAAQTAAPPPKAAPTGTPRNLLVTPPNSGDIALGEADVPTARFSGPWQTGSFEAYRFRRFPDASASLGADRQMTEWRIDITCLPTTGACTYTSQGTPEGGAMEAAERLGEWLVSLPPPPPVPEPEPPKAPETPPAAIPTVQASAEPEATPAPEAPDTADDPLNLPPAVTGPSLLPETEGTPPPATASDAAPVPQPLPPRSPTPATADGAPPVPQPLPPRTPTPPSARVAAAPAPRPAPAATAAAPVTPAPTAAPAVAPAPVAAPPAPAVAPAPPPAPAPVVTDVCGRLAGLEGDTPMERLQRLLAEEGFDPGPPDGQVGRRTIAAAREALDAPVEVSAVAQAVELIDRLLCDD
ncbi:hypothetical protein [Falsirhodobacter sp. 1013]|uniref:peptidoglycan-binding domain-containing protein n=1 Tax=Falsirhodobacter sp. 1013 TaxID=3417566 RepID=UPI003EBAD57A